MVGGERNRRKYIFFSRKLIITKCCYTFYEEEKRRKTLFMNKSYISRSKKWRRTLIYFSFVPLIGYAYTQNTNKMNCASTNIHNKFTSIHARLRLDYFREQRHLFRLFKIKGCHLHTSCSCALITPTKKEEEKKRLNKQINGTTSPLLLLLLPVLPLSWG